MKFPWLKGPDGVARPCILCSVKSGTKTLSTDHQFLIDTGADSTLIPVSLQPMLGFNQSDLQAEKAGGAGGAATIWRPKAGKQLPTIEVQIGGQWYSLPTFAFGHPPIALLGRDILFREFKLKMKDGETELSAK